MHFDSHYNLVTRLALRTMAKRFAPIFAPKLEDGRPAIDRIVQLVSDPIHE